MSSAIEFDAKSFVKNLTRQPGVYQMYNAANEILYVGKAKNLKNRVSSYFRQSGLSAKTEALVKRIAHIEITVTPSEADALVLEQNLIKAQRPPFNILMRDDKSYPYIFISEETYPRLSFHRGRKSKKGHYFGPFPNAGAVRESLHFLQKTFQVRQCEDSVFRNRTRPCLQYQIGRCKGPCVKAVSEQEYSEDVHFTQLFLDGQNDSLQQELATAMETSSEALRFEDAAHYRDQMTALRKIQAQNSVETGSANIDIVACALDGGEICVHVLYVRHGRILGSKSYFPKNKLVDDEGEIISQFLAQTYLGGRSMDIPSEVVVSHAFEDANTIIDAIKSEVGRTIDIVDSVRTHRSRWLAIAIEAAGQNLQGRLGSQQAITLKREALQKALQLDEPPARIECFDISHSHGELTKASCVVFGAEGPLSSQYRLFNIDGIEAGDDYAAMNQALTRRYSRLQKEEAQLPDLVIIDGGKGQLSTARKVMAELGLSNLALLGVAKGTTRKAGLETLVRPDGTEFTLQGDEPALHLIQQIRDEAHRFAITGHKQARDKKRRRSTLEDIEGIGPKRRRELIKHFGGLQALKVASMADIAKVPGISKKLAHEVYSVLHSD